MRRYGCIWKNTVWDEEEPAWLQNLPCCRTEVEVKIVKLAFSTSSLRKGVNASVQKNWNEQWIKMKQQLMAVKDKIMSSMSGVSLLLKGVMFSKESWDSRMGNVKMCMWKEGTNPFVHGLETSKTHGHNEAKCSMHNSQWIFKCGVAQLFDDDLKAFDFQSQVHMHRHWKDWLVQNGLRRNCVLHQAIRGLYFCGVSFARLLWQLNCAGSSQKLSASRKLRLHPRFTSNATEAGL